jgi:toxin ParE1/3/4
MRPYDLTLPAEEDLIDIWSYTDEKWSTKQADSYIHQLHACFDKIAHGQAAARLLPEIHVELGASLCQQHRVFYLRREKLIIIAVFHQRMDLLSRLADRLAGDA